LATGKKPLSEAAPPAPGRTQKTAQRSQVARRRLVVGGIVGVVVIGALVYLLSGGESPVDIPIIGNDDPETPMLVFETKTVPAATSDTAQSKLQDTVAPVGEAVDATMTTLFQGAFVDPEVWDGGDYEDLFAETMDEALLAGALEDVDTLTLGADAGDTYDFVTPEKSKLTVKVVTDPKDQPVQAIALVTFTALAELDDDTYTEITLTGTYFLRDQDGWRIFAYDATKDEEAAKAPKSPTPSSSEAAG
jgi:hypothetical protein